MIHKRPSSDHHSLRGSSPSKSEKLRRVVFGTFGSNSTLSSKLVPFIIFIFIFSVAVVYNSTTLVKIINAKSNNTSKKHRKHDLCASFRDTIPFNNFKSKNNTDDEERCEFNHHSSAPVPVILMSLGRSGSSVTWNTLSTMLGSTTNAYEVTGGNREKAVRFFEERSFDDWPVRHLCNIQKKNIEKYENPIISGFQWKPYRITLEHPKGISGLKAIASHTNPSIKVIFLSRSPLDRLISNRRHKGYQHTEEVPAHCAIDDQDCIDRHKAHAKGTTIPTGKELVQSLKSGEQIDRMCHEILSCSGIQYLSVKYEALYNDTQDVSEWIRIFDFLGKSPKNVTNYRENLTMKDVENAFAIAPTSSKRHRDTISNYEEVKKTLIEAGMQDLLH